MLPVSGGCGEGAVDLVSASMGWIKGIKFLYWEGRSGFGMGAELNPDPCPSATSTPSSTSWAPGLGTGLWGAEQFLELHFGVMGEGLVG